MSGKKKSVNRKRNRKKTGTTGAGSGQRRPTAWKPGQSGNPKGRKPLPLDYKLAMNDRIGPKGLRALEDILDNPGHPRHEQAAEYAVNRWKGTPTQRVEASGPGGGPIPVKAVLTSDEKRARVAALMAAARARAAAADTGTGGGDPGEDGPGDSD